MTHEGAPRAAAVHGPAPGDTPCSSTRGAYSAATDANSDLPGVLGEIAETAGRATAIRLALEWGGRDVHIPKPAHLERHPEHPLVAILVAEGTASSVAELLGGNKVYFPHARRACAVHLAAAGADAKEIAARLGISRSAARRYARGG